MAFVRPASVPFAKSAHTLPYRMVSPKPYGSSFGEGFINGCIERGLTDDQIADVMVKAAVAVGPNEFNRLLNRTALSSADRETMTKCASKMKTIWELLGKGRPAFQAVKSRVQNMFGRGAGKIDDVAIPGPTDPFSAMSKSTPISSPPGLFSPYVPEAVSKRWNKLPQPARNAIKTVAGIEAGSGLYFGQPIITSTLDDAAKYTTGMRFSNAPVLKHVPLYSSIAKHQRAQEANEAFNAALASPDTSVESLQKAIDTNYMLPSAMRNSLTDFVNKGQMAPEDYKSVLERSSQFTDPKALNTFLNNQQSSFDKAVEQTRKEVELVLKADGQDPARSADVVNDQVAKYHRISPDKLPWNRNKGLGAAPGLSQATSAADPNNIAKALTLDPTKLVTVKPEQVDKMQAQVKTSMDVLQNDFKQGKVDSSAALKAAHTYYKQSQALAAIAISKAAGKVIPMEQLDAMAKANDPTLLAMAKKNLESDPDFAKFVESILPKFKGNAEAASNNAFMQIWDSLGQGPLGTGGQIAAAGGLITSLLGLISLAMGGDGLGFMGLGLAAIAAAFGQSPMGFGGMFESGQGLLGNGLDYIKNIFNTGPTTSGQQGGAAAAGPPKIPVDMLAAAKGVSRMPPGPDRVVSLMKAVPFESVKTQIPDQKLYSKMIQRAAVDNDYLNKFINHVEKLPTMNPMSKAWSEFNLMP